MSPVTGLFFPVLLLNQRLTPPLRLQASHCSTFRIMCDVPSIAVFCSESIECFPGTVSKFFLSFLLLFQWLQLLLVESQISGSTFVVSLLLYFNFFFASFCTTFLSAGIVTSIGVHVFPFLFLILICDLFAVTFLSVCTA